MEIIAILGSNGKVKKWDGVIVSRFEANKRKLEAKKKKIFGEKVIQRDHGPDKKFLFSLSGGEHVLMQHKQGIEQVYRVTVISDGSIEFVHHRDARSSSDRKKAGSSARIYASPGTLFKNTARKVVIDSLGNILPAND